MFLHMNMVLALGFHFSQGNIMVLACLYVSSYFSDISVRFIVRYRERFNTVNYVGRFEDVDSRSGPQTTKSS